MVRAFLVSFLTRQFLFTGEAAFQKRYPNAWLVWEPGTWKVPTGDTSATKTMLPVSNARADKPATADALCFELPRADAPTTYLTLGRNENNDVVVNDATVSREHLFLCADAKGDWSVEVAPSSQPVVHGGQELAPGAIAPLKAGDRLALGDVVLTFLPPAELRARIGDAARALAR